jgi:hypothetical protein
VIGLEKEINTILSKVYLSSVNSENGRHLKNGENYFSIKKLKKSPIYYNKNYLLPTLSIKDY